MGGVTYTHISAFRYLRYEDGDPSFIEKKIGNVTAGMELTFEYGVRRQPTEKRRKPEPADTEHGQYTSVDDSPM